MCPFYLLLHFGMVSNNLMINMASKQLQFCCLLIDYNGKNIHKSACLDKTATSDKSDKF